MTVAALYVDHLGPYPSLDGVDAWPLLRDARRYAGPWPVIAHPPCGPWGRLSHLSRFQDPLLALRAVDQVRIWGGVLEHPADSKLWLAARLPYPDSTTDIFGGRTVAVCQCDFGHVARKRTWLYVVRAQVPAMPRQREPTHWISGGWVKGRLPHGMKICGPEQRRRTPIGFARWLVQIASTARP